MLYLLKLGDDRAQFSEAVARVAIKNGLFLNIITNSIIVAFVIFVVVKQYNKYESQNEEEKGRGSCITIATFKRRSITYRN